MSRNDAKAALAVKPTQTYYRDVKVTFNPESHHSKPYRAYFPDGQKIESTSVESILTRIDQELQKSNKIEPFPALIAGRFKFEEVRVNSIMKDGTGVNITNGTGAFQTREQVGKDVLQRRRAFASSNMEGLFHDTENNREVITAIGNIQKQINKLQSEQRLLRKKLTRYNWEDVLHRRKEHNG